MVGPSRLQRVRPLVDVAPVDDEVHLVLVEESHPPGADAASDACEVAVEYAQSWKYTMKSTSGEDLSACSQRPSQAVCAPPLKPFHSRDLVGDVVRVEGDEGRVAIAKGVRRRALGRAVVRKKPALTLPTVAVLQYSASSPRPPGGCLTA